MVPSAELVFLMSLPAVKLAEGPRSPSGFAEFCQNLCVKVWSNPEPGNLDQFIEHRFGQIDQASLFRSRHDAKQADDFQGRRTRRPAPTPFIHQQ